MTTSPEPVRYAYKASLAGVGWHYELQENALQWQANARHGSVPYRDISRMWLSFRPTSMQANRFRMDIRTREGGKLPVYSVTWKSMVMVEPQSDGYRQFVFELHRRIVAGGGSTEFRAGLSRPVFAIGLVAMAAVAFAALSLFVSAIISSNWIGALFMVGFVALFAWQLGGFMWRNHPASYDGGSPPERLMPRSGEDHVMLRFFRKLRQR
jgi:hypothetical protein